MTFKEWWEGFTGRTYEAPCAVMSAWEAGTAAERKRILGLLDKYKVTVVYAVKRAIEHPEPDAGETRAAQKV